MSKGKPCQADMSLREKQQMNLDTEGATHTGMEGQSRSSHKHLLLQVWCGILTVAMVVMAAFLASIKPKSTEDGVPTLRPENISPTINTLAAPLKSVESSLAYIQLIMSLNNNSWQESLRCKACSLRLHNNSIHCEEKGIYFFYTQVTFPKQQIKNVTKSVILVRNAMIGRHVKKLAEGTFPGTTEGSVWVAKIVNLQAGESVSLEITKPFLHDTTFWGAYQLH